MNGQIDGRVIVKQLNIHDQICEKGPKVGYGVINTIRCGLKQGFQYNELYSHLFINEKVINKTTSI